MRIDTDSAKTPETCATNSSSEEVYYCNLLYARVIHMNVCTMSKSDQWILRTGPVGQFVDTPRIIEILRR